MRALKLLGGLMVAVVLGTTAARDAVAIPILQLYIEGATYDDVTDTWVSTSTSPVRLWAIGNVDGEGGMGTITDVQLAIAYASGLDPAFTLTPSTTGGYLSFTDPSTPSAPTAGPTGDGTQPQLNDGSDLPAHGIYGSGTEWQQFELGDFSLTDSEIEDFNDDPAPTASGSTEGQINVYEVSVSGVDEGTVFHFDLFNHVVGGNDGKYVFAPFSHDAEGGGDNGGGGGGGAIPEPASVLVWGLLGLLGAVVARRRWLS